MIRNSEILMIFEENYYTQFNYYLTSKNHLDTCFFSLNSSKSYVFYSSGFHRKQFRREINSSDEDLSIYDGLEFVNPC